MRWKRLSVPLFLSILCLYAIVYFLGAPGVPFHPDESTQIFNSADFKLMLRNPAALFWQPGQEDNLRQRYRVLDAPLTRDLIGAGMLLSGQRTLPEDWDWGDSWEQNDQAGALPTASQLTAARLSVAWLLPFSILFLFLATRKATNEFTAWGAALLLMSNALVLLHTRRAMAESSLLFTTTLTLWCLVTAKQRPWLTAIPVGLAFCAKQTLAALIPVGLLAVLWQPWALPSFGVASRRRIGMTAGYLVLTAAVIVALNPYLWQHPIAALQASIQDRQTLASAQEREHAAEALNTPWKKVSALAAQTFFAAPSYAEGDYYTAQTQASVDVYQANAWTRLFRSPIGGGILLLLTLLGLLTGLVQILRKTPAREPALALIFTAGLVQILALAIAIPLPWQRYYLPILPFTSLWAAIGADLIRRILTRRFFNRPSAAD